MVLEEFKEKGNHLIYSPAMVRKSCLYFTLFLHHFYAIPLEHVLVRVYIVAMIYKSVYAIILKKQVLKPMKGWT